MTSKFYKIILGILMMGTLATPKTTVQASITENIYDDEREIVNKINNGADKVVMTKSITNAGYGNTTLHLENINRPIVIDLAGHELQSGTGNLLEIVNCSDVTIMNSANMTDTYKEQPDKNTYYTEDTFWYTDEENKSHEVNNVGILSMYGNGVPLVAEKSNITLEKVALHSADNRAVVLKDSKLTMNDSYIFRSHQGIYMQNSHLTMNGGAIANNTSWQYMDDSQGDWYNIANIPFYFGGGIYARTGSVVLDKNARIVSNEGGSGGGIALGSSKDLNYAGDTSTDRSATLYIKQGIVGNNKANQREGGGIATVWDTNSTVQIDNGKIINNKTGDMTSDWGGGGGLYIAEGTTLIMPYNTQVTQNTALGLGGGYYWLLNKRELSKL